MNINCVICSDLLTPTAEVFVTKCGHMFHYACLMNWLERKKSCPQCRNSVTEKTILKIYFNVTDVDGGAEDVGSLLNKIENLQFQICLNKTDVKTYKNKAESLSETNAYLRKEISEKESSLRTYESTILALKDQISYFKSKSKETDRLNSEIAKLKQNLKDLENVQLALAGTKDQVFDMLRNEHNKESLAILAATLKKSLLDVERKKRELEVKNTRLQNDGSKLKRELSELQVQNSDLKKELVNLKTNFEKEKQYLKKKIISLANKHAENHNNTIDRIVLESPVNFNRTTKAKSPDVESNKRTSTEKLPESTHSESPYLSLKTNPLCMDFSKPKAGFVVSPSKQGYSIFKSSHHKLDEPSKAIRSKSEYYDGFGGSSKPDIFPSPKPTKGLLKRHKSSSSVSCKKMKKLAPLSTKGKLDDFYSQP